MRKATLSFPLEQLLVVVEAEEARERAEPVQHARAVRALHQRDDAVDHLLARVDVDARVLVGHRCPAALCHGRHRTIRQRQCNREDGD